MKKVVYIASVGYSGSTLLDMLLGSNDNVTTLGEAYLLSQYAGSDAGCTCGEKVKDCKFWSQVEAEVKNIRGSDTSLADLNLGADGIKQTIFRKLPSLADVSLIAGIQPLWNLASKIDHTSQVFKQSAENAVLTYELASKIDNSEIIVDSSKYALPLKARYMELKEKFRVIFLVRDGRGVSKSLMKRQGLSMADAARKWDRFNFNLNLIMRTIPSKQLYTLKYEDLCNNTEQVLKDLTAFIGADQPLEIKPIIKENHHNIGGNPMRFRRAETEISIDESWKEKITDEELEIFEKIAGKTNRQNGYKGL